MALADHLRPVAGRIMLIPKLTETRITARFSAFYIVTPSRMKVLVLPPSRRSSEPVLYSSGVLSNGCVGTCAVNDHQIFAGFAVGCLVWLFDVRSAGIRTRRYD